MYAQCAAGTSPLSLFKDKKLQDPIGSSRSIKHLCLTNMGWIDYGPREKKRCWKESTKKCKELRLSRVHQMLEAKETSRDIGSLMLVESFPKADGSEGFPRQKGQFAPHSSRSIGRTLHPACRLPNVRWKAFVENKASRSSAGPDSEPSTINIWNFNKTMKNWAVAIV